MSWWHCFFQTLLWHCGEQTNCKGIESHLFAKGISTESVRQTNFIRHENIDSKLGELETQSNIMSWVKTTYIKYPEFKRQDSLPKEQIDAMVARLNTIKTSDDNGNATKPSDKQLSQKKIDDTLERLAYTSKNKQKTPERQRTGADQEMGIVNTFAWMNGRLLRSRVTRADGNWY